MIKNIVVCMQSPFKAAIVIFFVAIMLRIALVSFVLPKSVEGSESINIALQLYNSGEYGNAFGKNSGPTAHCMPVNPLMQAGLLKLFGTGLAGSFAIMFLACLEVAIGLALLPWLAQCVGLGTASGSLAGITGALLPINFWAQTSGAFESSLTFLLVIVLCCTTVALRDKFTTISNGHAFFLGCIIGFAVLSTTSVIPMLFIWLLIGVWKYRFDLKNYFQKTGIVVAAVFLFMLPWIARNYNVFGVSILTRSNLGLELFLSNRDGVGPIFLENFDANLPQHPLSNDRQREDIMQNGEYTYNSVRKNMAVDWVKKNPIKFATLSMKRFYYFWLTPMSRPIQTLSLAALTILGIVGILRLCVVRHPSVAIFSGVLLGYSLPYSLFQISARYHLAVEGILLLAGSSLLVCIFSKKDNHHCLSQNNQAT